MKNPQKLFRRALIISTFAIIICFLADLIMPTVIVETIHAQSTSNISQEKISVADQKALDKANFESRNSNYQKLNLTTKEISFSEDKSFDKNAINKKVDQYVSYNKKTGNATFNSNGFMVDRTVKLSKSNTNIVISITNKMIDDYNKSINEIPTLNESMVTTTSTKQTNNSKGAKVEITKSINARGVNIAVKDITNSTNNVSLQSLSAPSDGRTNIINRGWWGFDLFISHELVNKMFWIMVAFGVTSVASLLVTIPVIITACSLLGPISWAACAIGGAIILMFSYLTWAFRNDDIFCGQRGVYYQFRTWGGGGSTKALCQ